MNAPVAPPPLQRALITPEGIDLRVRIASASERAGALFIDFAIILGILIGFTLLAAAVLMVARLPGMQEATAVIWLLGAFVLRNFYFTALESSPRGATFGKRIMGLRVAGRDGGALNVSQVFGRNAMREIEFFLPLSLLVSQADEVSAMIALAGLAWCGVFLFFPFFNRDRLRVGDIVSGTWVIKAPKQVLLPDMADTATPALASYVFTQEQLDAYGVKELQVLESVLRQLDPQAVAAVAERIRAKIGWRKSPRELDSEFLQAYYAALRRRLEQRLLFGVRKRDKHDRPA